MENTLYDYANLKRQPGNWSRGSNSDSCSTDRTCHYFQIPAYQSGEYNLRKDHQRKFRNLVRCEVTIYLSLVFFLLLSFITAMMESASVQMAKNYRRADTNRAIECVFAEYQKELLEEYDIFALEGSYETGAYSEQNVEDRLSYYGAGNMEHEVERIQLLTDQDGKTFYEQAVIYMEHKYGIDLVKNMLGTSSLWKNQEEKAEEYVREEDESQKKLENLLAEQEGQLLEENNPIEHVETLKQSSLLELVVPKGVKLSEKCVSPGEMLSNRERQTGYGSFADEEEEYSKASELLFGEYLQEHFSSFTDQIQSGALDYELEYILAGKESDRQNLEDTVKQLLFLRFVPNYAYLQTDTAKKAEAEALAGTLCTLLTVPAITEAAAQAIILAWAYGETIMDIRSLLAGKKVPVAKSETTWQLSLSSLLTLGTGNDTKEGMDCEEGMDYQEYLRILLFLKEKDTLTIRALGIIEQNLRSIYGQDYFRADYCISRLELHTTCSLRRGIRYDFKTYYSYQ